MEMSQAWLYKYAGRGRCHTGPSSLQEDYSLICRFLRTGIRIARVPDEIKGPEELPAESMAQENRTFKASQQNTSMWSLRREDVPGHRLRGKGRMPP